MLQTVIKECQKPEYNTINWRDTTYSDSEDDYETAQVAEKSVTVNNNSPIQDYVHPNDQTQPTFSKDFVQEEDESFSRSVFKQDTEKEQKILGMLWNPYQHELTHELAKILEGVEVQPATRRLILSTATRFFDPLGLIFPVLPFKIMF